MSTFYSTFPSDFSIGVLNEYNLIQLIHCLLPVTCKCKLLDNYKNPIYIPPFKVQYIRYYLYKL